jgi:hypothetical protein
MAVRLSALRSRRPLLPGRFLVLISAKSWVDPRGIVRLEGLGQLKNPMTSSEISLSLCRRNYCCIRIQRYGRSRRKKRWKRDDIKRVNFKEFCPSRIHNEEGCPATSINLTKTGTKLGSVNEYQIIYSRPWKVGKSDKLVSKRAQRWISVVAVVFVRVHQHNSKMSILDLI